MSLEDLRLKLLLSFLRQSCSPADMSHKTRSIDAFVWGGGACGVDLALSKLPVPAALAPLCHPLYTLMSSLN